MLTPLTRTRLLARRRARRDRALGAGAAPAAADGRPPGEVVVRYERDADRGAARRPARTGVGGPRSSPPARACSRSATAQSVARPSRELRRHAPTSRPPRPNPIAPRERVRPPRPGQRRTPGGWQAAAVELPRRHRGVNAPDAWQNLIDAGRPGGRGVIVAVLDTGVAYADRGRFRRSPDLARRASSRATTSSTTIPYPHDENGHGTHVAGTIAEGDQQRRRRHRASPTARGSCRSACSTALGEGDAPTIAAGIRFAAAPRRGHHQPLPRVRHRGHARRDPRHARRAALRAPQGRARRRRRRATRAAAAVAYPARAATCCRSARRPSTAAWRTTPTTAPGSTSSPPAAAPTRRSRTTPTASPDGRRGRDIFQMTFDRLACAASACPAATRARRWPRRTSRPPPRWSSPPACSGRDPTPGAIEARLKATARDLGPPGHDRATAPGCSTPPRRPTPADPPR